VNFPPSRLLKITKKGFISSLIFFSVLFLANTEVLAHPFLGIILFLVALFMSDFVADKIVATAVKINKLRTLSDQENRT
jgi:hypothetical protein